jgi:hypothetical protein
MVLDRLIRVLTGLLIITLIVMVLLPLVVPLFTSSRGGGCAQVVIWNNCRAACEAYGSTVMGIGGGCHCTDGFVIINGNRTQWNTTEAST